ncbi:MAG: putative DNA binding domain-containing protein [Armatimonadetes bacterium]|nr:putative DNA binding domain-containing protein [Armatimonadota bacterium]
MGVSPEQLEQLLGQAEAEHLEFKEAKSQFDSRELRRYCVALSNEGGGRLILGVANAVPRRVVGTQAFANVAELKRQLFQGLHRRIEIDELQHPDGRVLVFTVPPRPVGEPQQYEGAYWMRVGEALVPMGPDQLRRIMDEVEPDLSAEFCAGATIADLDQNAIQEFRRRWQARSGSAALQASSDEQLLADAELLVDGGVTHAALILLGTRAALGRHLAQAEIIFEYRSGERAGPAQQRVNHRQGFFAIHDQLWETINLRNDRQHFQSGLFLDPIPTFDERVVREALLNAVCHRDYRLGGSVFIQQFPRRIEIVSPGGLPDGVTLDNILVSRSWRNRRVAETLEKCGLVERSGQGMNLIFERCIRESKALPDFSGTDERQVALTLHGEIQDPRFLQYLERVGAERLTTFGTDDFLLLDVLRRDVAVPDQLKPRLAHLLAEGVIERIGRGRGVRYLLSRSMYDSVGEKGVYTRQRGLDRKTNKALLEWHIRENAEEGSPLRDLQQVLPALSKDQVQKLLTELRAESRIRLVGQRRWARWYPALDEAAPGVSGQAPE